MKRSVILLAMLLVLLACLPALSEDLPVFLLEQDGAPVGSAVLFGSENTLLTTIPVPSTEGLYVLSGEEKVPAEIFPDQDQLLSLVLTETALPGTPMELGQVSLTGLEASGFLPDGAITQSECLHVAYLTQPAGLTLSADALLLPGAVLTNGDGELCGLIAASLGEGVGRYFALSSAEIYARLTEEDTGISSPEVSYIQYTATVEGSHVHLDWSEAPEAREDGIYCVYCSDLGNTYYTYQIGTECTDDFPVVPGRTYRFYVRELASEEDDAFVPGFPDEGEPISIPSGGTFTRYGFRDLEVFLACLDENETVPETTILSPFTDYANVFTHPGVSLYLQVSSTYEVTEESYADLTCALLAPDGTCYSMQSGYIFAPEYMPKDSWHMEITELFDECFQSVGGPSGTYRLQYFLDAELATEITFEVP